MWNRPSGALIGIGMLPIQVFVIKLCLVFVVCMCSVVLVDTFLIIFDVYNGAFWSRELHGYTLQVVLTQYAANHG